uniref:EGF-like domain-containing protein n=1 Tax=Quercus lobata TaxID=97700 RepID=A0A7N2LHT9_QUELO
MVFDAIGCIVAGKIPNSGDMGFLGILIQVTWVAVMLSELAAAAVAFPIALPNCPDKCGDVEIPYPFGLREGCYIGQNFFVNCTNSTQPSLLGGLTATNFSLEGQAHVLVYIAMDCYKQGVLDPDLSIWASVYLDLGLNFTISSTQNKFIVVGCDTYAYLDFQQDKENFSTGCVSVCGSSRYIVNGSCSGVGCCEVDIPNGLNYVTLESYSFKNHTKVGAFNPCGYAFISQQTTFNFSIDSLHSLQHQNMTPVVLDWAIGTEKCKEVVNKSNYTCGGNSTCIDSDNGSGYRCKCMEGYHGNPYLHLGCQDINECENPNHCKLPGEKCINLLGNFTCSCIKGYHLDVSAGICVTNQSSRLVTLLVGKYTYCIAP